MGIILDKSRQEFDQLIGSSSFNQLIKNYLRDYYVYGFKSYDQFLKGKQTVDDRWRIFSTIMGMEWDCVSRGKGQNQILLRTEPVDMVNPLDAMYLLHNLSQFESYLTYLLDLDPRSVLRGGSAMLPIDTERLYAIDGRKGSLSIEHTNGVDAAIMNNWIYDELGSGADKEGAVRHAASAHQTTSVSLTSAANHAAMAASSTSTAPAASPVTSEWLGIPRRVRINRQLRVWSDQTATSHKHLFDIPSERAGTLYTLGVLGDLRDTPDIRNHWVQHQLAQDRARGYRASSTWANTPALHATANSSMSGTDRFVSAGDHYWYRSPLTMHNICNQLDGVPCMPGTSLLEQLRALFEFYAQYYPLSEIGTILAERCSSHISNDLTLFRFRHHYIQQSLYDYNLLDLMTAVEHQYKCVIQYTHGTRLDTYEGLVVPLEIRINTINGREFLLYYNIRMRMIYALRLEFIDSITIYSDITAIRSIQRSMRRNGRKIQTKVYKRVTEPPIDEADLQRQLQIARQMLPHIWGADVSGLEVCEDWESQLLTFSSIAANMAADSDIRIFRTNDLRPRLRSRYGSLDITRNTRLVTEPSQNSSAHSILSETMPNGFCLWDDVTAMWNVYHSEEGLPVSPAAESRQGRSTNYKEYVLEVEGTVAASEDTHEGLFHELFSRFAIVMADAVLDCSARGETTHLEEILRARIAAAFPYYSEAQQRQVQRELQRRIQDAGLISADGAPRFLLPDSSYLYDILPLTRIELRWLAAVLADPLAQLFLTPEQICCLQEVLRKAPSAVTPLRMDVIRYYDCYDTRAESAPMMQPGPYKIGALSRHHSAEECRRLRALCTAMRQGNSVRFDYDQHGLTCTATCHPAWIAYSRKDNAFELWYVHHKDQRNEHLPLSRIRGDITVLDQSYEISSERQLFDTLHRHNMTSIRIEFYQGTRNLPDRILTELSLWRKECVYDPRSQHYTITLYYSTYDTHELCLRLLGYGPYIQVIADEDNALLRELKDAIDRQYERMQEQ